MGKRIFAILLVGILLMALSPAALADVIIGNEFFHQHEDKIQELDRYRFIANGPNGHVSAKKAPGSGKETTVYQNGEDVLIASTYIYKGKYWGITPFGHFAQIPGWIPMDQLLVKYSQEDFEAEHQDELYAYTGGFDALFEAEAFYLWQWPGSDREKIYYDMPLDADAYRGGPAYRDNESREWVYIVIFGGWLGNNREITDGWICLTDPSNSDIPAFNPAPAPTKWLPDVAQESASHTLLFIILLIFVLVAGTIVLQIMLRKPDNTKKGGKSDE